MKLICYGYGYFFLFAYLCSPLHHAATKGHTRYLEALIREGQSPNSRNQYGNTLLHLASLNGHEDTIETLIEYGADLFARNKFGNTLMHNAALNGHVETLELLHETYSLDINTKNNAGSTPLHYACLLLFFL